MYSYILTQPPKLVKSARKRNFARSAAVWTFSATFYI